MKGSEMEFILGFHNFPRKLWPIPVFIYLAAKNQIQISVYLPDTSLMPCPNEQRKKKKKKFEHIKNYDVYPRNEEQNIIAQRTYYIHKHF